MGKIKVRGYAESKVEVDECIYTIKFTNTSAYGEDAIRRVKQNSELFLNKLKGLGIDITKLHLEDDGFQDTSRSSSKKCSRVITFSTDASARTNNMLLNIIQDNKIEASISTCCQYSKKEELHKQLLEKAVKDSRQKAEIIANANNNRVINIDYVTFDRYEYDEYERGNYERVELCTNMSCPSSITDELANRLEIESEEIFITWNID